MMEIRVLEQRLQSQQRQVNQHRRYLVIWFHDHIVLMTTGIVVGALCLGYIGYKSHKLKWSPNSLMQMSRLLMVYLAKYATRVALL